LIELAHRHGLSGVLLLRPDNFAWITGGGFTSGPRCAHPPAAVFVREDGRRFLFAAADEVGRNLAAEMGSLGYASRLIPFSGEVFQPPEAVLSELSGGRAFGSDTPRDSARMLAREISGLRVPLTRWEVRKYRWLGNKCAEAADSVCRRIRPWMTDRGIEAEVAGLLGRHAIQLQEARVVADCPVPGSAVRKVEKYAVVNISASRWGLLVALARAVHIGPVSRELRERHEALASVQAGYWAQTRPGERAVDIFRGGVAAYTACGHADAWEHGPQGGRIGYERREWTVTAGADQEVGENQAFAWRPSIQDAVTEDTVLLDGDRFVVLTEIPGWPVIERKAIGRIYRIPGLLVIESQ